jgi:5-hydroxyisourate hydrolase
MGKLSTHILDIAKGRPAQGIPITVERQEPDGSVRLLNAVVSNADGRCDVPLLADAEWTPGVYALHFRVGAYLAQHHAGLGEPGFLDHITLRFGLADGGQSYHVPLLLSPYGYSTYRGS